MDDKRNELLTLKDVARLVGVSYSTLTKWSSRGWPDFPKAIRLPNGQIRVKRADLEDWVESRRRR